MSGERKEYPFGKVVLRIIPIQLRAVPFLTCVTILMGAVHSLTWTASVIATQRLFDTISDASVGTAGFWDCVIPLLVLAGVTFGQQIMNGVHNFMAIVADGKAIGPIGMLLHRKLQRIDPAKFEDTSFLDDLNKAREGVKTVPYVCTMLFLLLSFYMVYFASIGVYLFRLKPMLLITLVIAFIPAMLAQIVRGRVFTKLEEQNASLRREYEYYQKTICDREYFKETRILGAFKYFHQLFSDTMRLLTLKTWQAERKTALLQLLLSTSSFVGMAISSYMLFDATMAGEITVGAFAAVYSALGQIFGIMQEVITFHLGAVNRDIGKVANFVRMLDTPECEGAEGVPDLSKGIVAENIFFLYPGRGEPAVRGVSLAIAGDEIIAIVGENGAGKSTLVRLLTGVYRPSEGSVTVGGLDTAKYSPKAIFGSISGVFQKYQRYKMTLSENIEISDIRHSESDKKLLAASHSRTHQARIAGIGQHKSSECLNKSAAPSGYMDDRTRMEAALKEADMELDGETLGFDTMLSPEFDGIDLSGGQWQRLAIARGLYRQNDVIVLDEPTAAIDPIEETRIYTQFQKLAEGKCAVVVTHRLGSAKLAHRIVVMDAGKIADIGTHDELISRPGKYADMWKAQAQWYERTEVLT